MVIKGYDSYEVFLGKDKTPAASRKVGGDHYHNFIEAVRAQDKSLLNGPVETAHLSSGLAHLGNIAHRTGRVLNFDPKTEKFIGDEEANTMLTRDYRAPYVISDNV